MPAKQKQINLLPQEEFDQSPLGRTLKWAVTTFRAIVIVTELIVIVAFLSRFWLDAKNADLNDLIRQNQAIIASNEDFEAEFRQIQERIEIFSGLTSEATLSSLTSKAINLLPDDVKLVSISQVENSLQIKGVSASEISIVQYLTNLASDASFKEVRVTNAVASPENQSLIIFTLEVKLSEKGGD